MRVLLCLCLFTVGCTAGRARDLRAHYRAEDVRLAQARLDPNYRSADGFQTTHWGMRRDEVKALFTTATEWNTGLLADGVWAEHPARFFFEFSGDRLSGVRAALLDVTNEASQFVALQSLLTDTYGAPASQWTGKDLELSQLKRQEAQLKGVAVFNLLSAGQGLLLGPGTATQLAAVEDTRQRLENTPQPQATLWLHQDTRVVLAGRSAPAAQLVVSYQSRVLDQPPATDTVEKLDTL